MSQISTQKLIYYKQKNFTTTISDFLAKRFPYLTHEAWCQAIERQKIKVNHKQTTRGYVLQHLDIITYERAIEDEPEVDREYNILWEDRNFLVVEKGSNLPVSVSGRYYQNTLIEILKDDGYQELRAVHRIDKETSGLVLFAKGAEAAVAVGRIFSAAKHIKTYHAILDGKMEEAQIVVDQPLAKNKGESMIHIRQSCTKDGKAAKTIFTRVVASEQLTFAEIMTHRGRTHQIRCHAEHIALPILGDKLYGKSDQEYLDYLKMDKLSLSKGGIRVKRQLLHASRLGFIDPFSGQRRDFFSDPLQSFEREISLGDLFLEQLGDIKLWLANFKQGLS